MTAEEARYAALRSFGNPTLLREQARATWSWNWLESAVQDLRYAGRSLRSAPPGFSATVIGTLALGIGAATAMVTVVDHELLRPLAVPRCRATGHNSGDGRLHPELAGAMDRYRAVAGAEPIVQQHRVCRQNDRPQLY